MNAEETLWWGWSGLAGGSWAAVVCLVVILGSVVNFAVLVHWFTTKPTPETPSAALPFVDLLVCLLAAPLRYASNAPSEKLSPLTANVTADLQEDDGGALLIPDLEDEVVLYEAEKIAFYVTQVNDTEYEEESPTPLSSSDSIHAVVVFICLASLHVVVMVAVHRLALLLRCSPTVLLPFRMTPPVFVLLLALASAGALVGSLHATGQFTEHLPLLGTMKYPADLSPSSVVVGFLSYAAGLCGIAVFCYGTIIATLLYQGRDRAVTNSRQDPLPLTSSTTSSVAMQQSPGDETTVQTYSGHGRAIRACMTVVSVVVTLAVCWAIPISLALYALMTDTQITPALPYSDILLLLSGLIHPFVYGEGWIAVAACYNGVRNMTSATAYRMGLTKRTRTPVHATVRGRRLQQEEEPRRLQHQYVSYCCPCRAASRIPDTQLFSEAATTFVNSFPLRHALSRQDPDPL
ncbi:uncharacterized protein LOC135218706 [Macrobrachium nipponense]|uniref:uncharacterized protein LOC135218706 n=1 Tax=Macrobrachium nipponense TaxID=159736 RepID=UPI0030C835BB